MNCNRPSSTHSHHPHPFEFPSSSWTCCLGLIALATTAWWSIRIVAHDYPKLMHRPRTVSLSTFFMSLLLLLISFKSYPSYFCIFSSIGSVIGIYLLLQAEAQLYGDLIGSIRACSALAPVAATCVGAAIYAQRFNWALLFAVVFVRICSALSCKLKLLKYEN